MEIWRAQPGDVLRIRSHYPETVTVTDSDAAGVGWNLIHWETEDEHGQSALPDQMDVELLFTENPAMEAFVTVGLADREG